MEEASTSKPTLTYPSSYAKKPYTPSQRGKEIVASKDVSMFFVGKKHHTHRHYSGTKNCGCTG